MPVMRVHDQVAFADAPRDLDRRGGEEREATRIVGIVAARVSINAGSIERRIVLEEDGFRIIVAGLVPEPHLFTAAGALHREGIAERFERADVAARLAIQRQDHVALRSAPRLVVGETSDRLSEAARPGIRPQFGGEMENAGLQRALLRGYGGGAPGIASPTAAGT